MVQRGLFTCSTESTSSPHSARTSSWYISLTPPSGVDGSERKSAVACKVSVWGMAAGARGGHVGLSKQRCKISLEKARRRGGARIHARSHLPLPPVWRFQTSQQASHDRLRVACILHVRNESLWKWAVTNEGA
jgi:hypothetical protein